MGPAARKSQATGQGASKSASARKKQGARGAVQELPADLAERPRHDFERLERAVVTLVDRHALLSKENLSLEARLQEREQRVKELEAELEEAGARRQRATERLDALISDLDRLDEQTIVEANACERSERGASAASPAGSRRGTSSAEPPSQPGRGR